MSTTRRKIVVFACAVVLLFYFIQLFALKSKVEGIKPNVGDAPTQNPPSKGNTATNPTPAPFTYVTRPGFVLNVTIEKTVVEFPSEASVAVIIMIRTLELEPACNLLAQTINNVLDSTWKKVTVHVFEREGNLWSVCMAPFISSKPTKADKESKQVRYYPNIAPFSVRQIVNTVILGNNAPAYVMIMEPGDTMYTNYIERAVWVMYSRTESAIGYVGSYYSIVDEISKSATEVKHFIIEAVSNFYGTSPGSVFSTQAIKHTNAFDTLFDHYQRQQGINNEVGGCEDWEAKWRMHIAKWNSFTIRNVEFFKHVRNVHNPRAFHLRCMLVSDQNIFLKYLQTQYQDVLPKITLQTLPDMKVHLKKQHGLDLTFDPLYYATKPRQSRLTKKTLLVLIPWLVIGGAEAVSLNVVRLFASAGWHVVVVMFSEWSEHTTNAWEPQAREYTQDIFYLPHWIDRNYYHKFLCHLIRSRGVDAIFNNNCLAGYIVLPFLANFCPVGAFLDINHNWFDYYYDGGYASFSIDFQQHQDYQVQISQDLATRMVSHGADPAKVKVAYIGTNTTFYTNSMQNAKTKRDCMREFAPDLFTDVDDKFVVLYLGRLAWEKQPNVFLEAVIKLKQTAKKPFVAIIAGAGAMQNDIEWRIKNANVSDTVKYIGAVDAERKRRLLSCVDALMSTSKTEGTPLVIFEAMSVGAAIIAPKVGGIPEMVPSNIGTLIDNECSLEEQAARYAKALSRYVHMNASHLGRIKKLARHRALTKYDLNVFGKALFDLIAESTAKKAKNGYVRADLMKRWPQVVDTQTPEMKYLLATMRMLLAFGWYS